MILFGLWVGAVCITGFNYAVSSLLLASGFWLSLTCGGNVDQMQYIPPLVFSAVSLVDPAVTALLSWGFGIESLPSLFSWLGGATVIAGVAAISYGERLRTQGQGAGVEGDFMDSSAGPSKQEDVVVSQASGQA